MKNNLLKLSRDWHSEWSSYEWEMFTMIRISETNIVYIGQTIYSLYLNMDYAIGVEMDEIINLTISETEAK